MPKLTKHIIEAAEIRTKDYFLWDEDLPGFGLRVRPSGRKIYIVQYRANGRRPRRMNLGLHNILPLEKARNKAMGILSDVGNGEDPSAKRQETRNALTVRDLADRFDAEHIALHVKPTTANGYRINLRTIILPAFGDMAITDVMRLDVAKLHTSLHKSPAKANRCLGIISKMFNLAELWGLRADNSNPCRHLSKYKENKRERYLSAEEMQRLGETLRMVEEASLCSPYAVAAFRLLILTGARLGEIRDCKWEYVHLDKGIIRLPDSKTGPKFIHLGRSAIDLLRTLPRKEGNSYLICSDHKPDEPIYDLQTTWQKIRKWAGIEDVRIHDLRHTFASNAVAMGMSLPMIGKLLGHTQTQTTARYAHLALDPILEAASKVTTEIGGLLALPPPSDPITIEGQARSIEVSALANVLAIESVTDVPRFLTPKQAASYLNINPRLLENWRWKRCGPRFVKVGNSVRYTQEDLEAYAQPGG